MSQRGAQTTVIISIYVDVTGEFVMARLGHPDWYQWPIARRSARPYDRSID